MVPPQNKTDNTLFSSQNNDLVTFLTVLTKLEPQVSGNVVGLRVLRYRECTSHTNILIGVTKIDSYRILFLK